MATLSQLQLRTESTVALTRTARALTDIPQFGDWRISTLLNRWADQITTGDISPQRGIARAILDIRAYAGLFLELRYPELDTALQLTERANLLQALLNAWEEAENA